MGGSGISMKYPLGKTPKPEDYTKNAPVQTPDQAEMSGIVKPVLKDGTPWCVGRRLLQQLAVGLGRLGELAVLLLGERQPESGLNVLRLQLDQTRECLPRVGADAASRDLEGCGGVHRWILLR